jgi:type IV pilus assembly protein PilB
VIHDKTIKLGEMLLSEGLITEEQLRAALVKQQTEGGRIGEILVNAGALSAQALVKCLAKRLGAKGCCLRHGLIDPKVARLLGRDEAERLGVLPMFKVGEALTVAMAEPQSLPTIDRLSELTHCQINPVLVLPENIAEYSAKYLSEEANVETFLTSLSDSDVQFVEREADEGPVTNLDRMVEGSPIVNLVNLAILRAVRDGASDIHVEPDKRGTRVRYRIDGVLRELMSPPKGMHAAIISRLKVIAKMDIAEKRLPQEGRVHIVAEGREIDIRASAMPTILGEKVVLRILDKANLNMEMESLGLRSESLAKLQHMLRQPHGMVLVTGPTGSGKTTTLYSALDLLRSIERNIVTVEDPVEYQLDLINQVQAHAGIGMTFARALRSILRQDPDVVMIGEIRDADTAQIAVQAALTGHLVLSTLHTNDSISATVRLMDMGVEPYLIASTVIGVVAQRLARKVCPNCRTKTFASPTLLAEVGWQDRANQRFVVGEGCRQCHDSGLRGRLGIFEIMEVDAGLRELIHVRADYERIEDYLRRNGWLSLREEGLLLVEQGASSLEEILRVTRSESDYRQKPAVPPPAAEPAGVPAAVSS